MTEQTVTEQVDTTPQPSDTKVETKPKEKALTQAEVDELIEQRVARERSKYEKKYKNIDLDHYNQLVEQEEARKQQELEKRGEYERLLKEQAEKFSSKIQTYESELHSIKIDGTLLNEASRAKAVNPEQVTQLLKHQLRLNEAGGVDVIDTKGAVRYSESGTPLQVQDLVNEFLTTNPHFKSAGPQGTGTQGAIGKQQSLAIELNQLDMKNPKHREIYRQKMAEKGVRI